MIKILLISYHYGITASGVISKRVAEHLEKRGHRVTVITESRVNDIGGEEKGVQIITVRDPWNKGDLLSKIIQRIKRTNNLFFYNYIWVRRATSASRRVVKEFNPDIIYCRTSPEDACYVGHNINHFFSLPMMVHFSDPIPPPLEYLPRSIKRNWLIKKIRAIIEQANIISYGNEYMLRYDEKALGIKIGQKAFISPDVASGDTITYFPQIIHKKLILTYLGTIYGGRNPKPLFEAIKKAIKEGSEIELRIYSNIPSAIIQDYPFIICCGYSNDVLKVLKESDILIDLDGDDKEPVFISSKLKDYLLINRPILSITPPDSPSRELLSNKETIYVVENNSMEIEKGIALLQTKIDDELYEERLPIISYFNPVKVSATIEDKMKSIIKTC